MTPGDHRPARRPAGTEARVLEDQIHRIRDELDEMVGELDRRRHDALDVRLQVRRHAGLVAVVGVVVATVAIGGVIAWTASRRRQDRLVARLQQLGRAVVVMSRRPGERLEPAPAPATGPLTALAQVAGIPDRWANQSTASHRQA
jgi:hypothetical protein